MADELLPFYEKELAFIRQMGADFARENQKIAARLGISEDTVEDPHVSRLIEGFAYLNARIQHKLADDFPEISDALLEVLFPHYLRPIPTSTIVQFIADREKLESAQLLKRETLLETEPVDGETCQFSTIYDTWLLPFEVSDASLMGRPFATPGSSQLNDAASQAVLKLSLKTFNSDLSFRAERPERLRFYLKGQPQHVNPLFELLLGKCRAIVMCAGEDDPQPVRLPVSTIRTVGFGTDEGMLPYPDSSFLGYRLLTEYFAFPAKFLFFDLVEFSDRMLEQVGDRLEFYFYLEDFDAELEHNISAETFQLGCVPAINLFRHRVDPIRLDHQSPEYEIIPDVRRPDSLEIYNIESVRARSSDGELEAYRPMFGIDHQVGERGQSTYWFASRRHAKLGQRIRDDASDVYLSLVDLEFNPNLPDDRTLLLETRCSNRDLPARLPFSEQQPRLQCVDEAPPCERIRCLLRPGPTIRPPLGNGARWRLISHLSLNYLSITGHRDATPALKEILRLYDFTNSAINRAQIDAIVAVDARSISSAMPIDGRISLCRGTEIEITLDDHQLSGTSAYLFATVLEHFFALYCSINSFTRVLVRLQNREGYLKECPPRSGEQVLR